MGTRNGRWPRVARSACRFPWSHDGEHLHCNINGIGLSQSSTPQLAINLRPESTGTITLKSKNSWDAPIIDAKYVFLATLADMTDCIRVSYFASETDLNVVVRAVRLAQRLAHELFVV